MSAHPTAEPTFDPVAAARAVLHSARTASLATLTGEGHPFASLVTFATLPDLAPVLWLSDLAVHSRNLAREARASLLVVAPGGEGGDPLAGARVTLTGTVARTEDPAAARRFGWVHGSAGRPDFADFHAYRMEVASAHLVAGFGRIVTLTADDLLIDLADAEGLLSGEAMVVDHMNEDHGDAIGLYATVLLGLPPADWRLSGCDPDGVDLVADGIRARLPFPGRAATVAEAGGHLKNWAKLARERMSATKN
ncbi:HugZ family protein [Kaistia soli]|uniref:HugZ family pyridoxamine 5'-phosphate oxidase n=1 Tax=Kaistia soli TaxID=446684 RepID=UPI0009344A9F|nr:pyridoxamine 5'-phosphate oxidase family protein [Kaistia soli]